MKKLTILLILAATATCCRSRQPKVPAELNKAPIQEVTGKVMLDKQKKYDWLYVMSSPDTRSRVTHKVYGPYYKEIKKKLVGKNIRVKGHVKMNSPFNKDLLIIAIEDRDVKNLPQR